MMIERDFRSRYVGSTAGLLWSVIHPLLMVGIYTLIFSLVFGRQIGNAPFALWLFCGLLPWIMFSEILKNSSGVLEKHRNLITKTPFHPEILSLVVIGSSLTGHLIGFAVLLALISVFSQPPGVMILSVGLYLTCLILFVLGLSWFISSVNIFFRDVAQGVNVVLQLWFYLTPIIYPSSIIPENYRVLLRLNPMYFITEGYRKALLTGEGIAMTDFVYFTTLTLLVLFGGGWVFRRLKTQFAEIL
jgi:ABC-type polysaccharide/polyol phosphate export permease